MSAKRSAVSALLAFALLALGSALAQATPVVPGSAWVNVTSAVQNLGDFGPFEARQGRGFINRCATGVEAITGADMRVCVASVGSAVLRITARVEGGELAADVASGLFGLLASLPYTQAQPTASKRWASQAAMTARVGSEALRRVGVARLRVARATAQMFTFELQHYKYTP